MKMIAWRFGYDITTDLNHGFTLVWGRKRRRMLALHWDWPDLTWYDKYWAVNEKGYVKGMPVWRVRRKKWLLRAIRWPHEFRYVNDCAKERLTPWQ